MYLVRKICTPRRDYFGGTPGLFPFVIAIALVVSGCSVEISQPTTATPTLQAETATPIFTPITLMPVNPVQGNLTASPTTLPTPRASTAVPTEEIPVTWANLKLTGKLVFTSANMRQDNEILRIQILDLATGQISKVFQTTGSSWIYYMTVSSVNNQIVISYTPPLGYNSPTHQTLYIFPLDGSQLYQLLFNPASPDDVYPQAEWSPDGKYIYYVHSSSKPQYQGQLYPIYEIFRMAYPDGQPEKIAENAFWPRLSSDLSQLIYVFSDPDDGLNKIFVANADGSNAHQVVLTGQNVPDIIDAPIFSPDGQSILFSAPTPLKVYQPNWLEKLLGVQVAEAHSIPSEWWSVSLSGGTPKQLTHIQSPVLFASVAPDGRYIVSYSGNGLFVMKADGSEIALIYRDLGGIAGMVSWIP